MLNLFRKVRKNLLRESKFSRYLVYAVGEIVLVVIGILIAIQINGWNEERKNEKQLKTIFNTILTDLVQDTAEVKMILDNYNLREPVFKAVLNDSATMVDYQTKPFYGVLITSYVPFSMEKKGYHLLNEFNNFNGKGMDTVAATVTQFYGGFIKIIDDNEAAIKKDVMNNLDHWKNTKPWFADISINKPVPGFFNYVLNDPDYKNRVAYHSAFVYTNHVPVLKAFNQQASHLINMIKKQL